jgi:hypothetical protein
LHEATDAGYPHESLGKGWFRGVWNELDAAAIDGLVAPKALHHCPGRGPAPPPA